jgi:hypothetical protein
MGNGGTPINKFSKVVGTVSALMSDMVGQCIFGDFIFWKSLGNGE